MSKKPCYTCQEPFVDTKLQVLLENKRNEAKEYAKKNNYTGSLAIVLLDSQNGFKVVKSEDKAPDVQAREYLLFSQGVAI